MSGRRLVLGVAVVAVVCLIAANGQVSPPRSSGTLPGIPCSQMDVVNMLARCMIKFVRGHTFPVITKMRKGLTCDAALINCQAVMDTRVCIANLTESEMSTQCRPHIDAISDHQFSRYELPCRVSHMRTKCMAFFAKHGLTTF